MKRYSFSCRQVLPPPDDQNGHRKKTLLNEHLSETESTRTQNFVLVKQLAGENVRDYLAREDREPQ